MTIYVWANTWPKALIEAHRGIYYFTIEKAQAEHRHSDVEKLWRIHFEETVWNASIK